MIAACGVNGLTCALVQVGEYFIRSDVMKSIVAIGLAAGLAGCSNARYIERDEATPASTSLEAAPSPGLEAKPLLLNLNDALADCRSGYSNQITQAVMRALCIIKATEQLRPLLPFPYLLDRENALRKSLAEQVQNASASLLERNRQMNKIPRQYRRRGAVSIERKACRGQCSFVGGDPMAVVKFRWVHVAGRKYGKLLLRTKSAEAKAGRLDAAPSVVDLKPISICFF